MCAEWATCPPRGRGLCARGALQAWEQGPSTPTGIAPSYPHLTRPNLPPLVSSPTATCIAPSIPPASPPHQCHLFLRPHLPPHIPTPDQAERATKQARHRGGAGAGADCACNDSRRSVEERCVRRLCGPGGATKQRFGDGCCVCRCRLRGRAHRVRVAVGSVWRCDPPHTLTHDTHRTPDKTHNTNCRDSTHGKRTLCVYRVHNKRGCGVRVRFRCVLTYELRREARSGGWSAWLRGAMQQQGSLAWPGASASAAASVAADAVSAAALAAAALYASDQRACGR